MTALQIYLLCVAGPAISGAITLAAFAIFDRPAKD